MARKSSGRDRWDEVSEAELAEVDDKTLAETDPEAAATLMAISRLLEEYQQKVDLRKAQQDAAAQRQRRRFILKQTEGEARTTEVERDIT